MTNLDCTIRDIVLLALSAYYGLMIVRIVLSWLPISPPPAIRPAFNFTFDITEPFLRLFRGILPPLPLGGVALDLSAIIAFLVLYIAQIVAARMVFPNCGL